MPRTLLCPGWQGQSSQHSQGAVCLPSLPGSAVDSLLMTMILIHESKAPGGKLKVVSSCPVGQGCHGIDIYCCGDSCSKLKSPTLEPDRLSTICCCMYMVIAYRGQLQHLRRRIMSDVVQYRAQLAAEVFGNLCVEVF